MRPDSSRCCDKNKYSSARSANECVPPKAMRNGCRVSIPVEAEHRVQIIGCGSTRPQTNSALTSTALEYPAPLPGYQIARSQPTGNVRVTCAYGTKMARFLSLPSRGAQRPGLSASRLRQTTFADTPIMGRRHCILSEQRDSTVWTWEQLFQCRKQGSVLTPAVRNREQKNYHLT